jgi:hypothetical protein
VLVPNLLIRVADHDSEVTRAFADNARALKWITDDLACRARDTELVGTKIGMLHRYVASDGTEIEEMRLFLQFY